MVYLCVCAALFGSSVDEASAGLASSGCSDTNYWANLRWCYMIQEHWDIIFNMTSLYSGKQMFNHIDSVLGNVLMTKY